MPDDRPDAEVLAAVASGDRDALAVLYQRHATWMLKRLQRRCGDPEVIDDALQDTFVVVWRDASRFAARGDVPAWMWGICIRRLLDGIRRRSRAGAARQAAVWPTEGRREPSAQSAEDQVLQGVEYGDLGTALNTLSPELRVVVQATLLDGLSTRETAHLLGIPAGTVKTRMMRARAQLKEALA